MEERPDAVFNWEDETAIEARLQAIEKREKRATAGPWHVHNPEDNLFMNVYLVATTPQEPNPWWDGEAEARKVVAVTWLYGVADVADGKGEENAEFIAHARTDIPFLLHLVRRQQQELAHLRTQLVASGRKEM